MLKIVLTGGGTAGHCQPNINLLPFLANYFDKIYYIGSNGIEKKLIAKTNIQFFEITSTKLIRNFCWQNFKIPFKLLKAINQSKNLLLKLKPDVVFSKGGYVSLPVVISAHNLKIPVISHESDYSIGLANKIGAKFSNLLLTAYKDTANNIKNAKYVGAPLRTETMPSKTDALKFFNLSNYKPILLIFGGSLGSQALNIAIEKNVDTLLENFNILHVTGNNTVKINKPNYVSVPYVYNMAYAYAVTDICLSRAGSNALFELAHYKIPSVIVPLPKTASRGDQIENANYFSKLGIIKHLPQENLNNTLVSALNEVYLNRNYYYLNMKNYPVNNACFDIANLLKDYATLR